MFNIFRELRIIVIVAFAIAFSSCDMFSTRPSEEPESPRTNYNIATTPDILIQNLKDSFRDKVPENYLACFIDSSFSDKNFVFLPSAESISRYPFLTDWSLQGERSYFINLVNSVDRNSPIILSFEREEKNFSGDSTIYSSQYSLSIPVIDDQRPKYYQGELRFTMIRDSRLQWVIYRWEDIKDKDFLSWSDLKGTYF